HRDQRHETRSLEEQQIVRVHHTADRFGVGDAFGHFLHGKARRFAGNGPASDDHHQLDQDDDADQRADRQILQEALAQFGEIDVEHHDDEEEQNRDRADIDDDEDHREEFSTHQQEEARGVEERQD